MKRILFSVCCALIVSIGYSPTAAAERPRDLASETRGIFSAKCAGCHGSNLPRPKGRFGYVLDLKRVAANRELIVPSFPDESGLWELVDRGEMPPDDSPSGPLTDEEKEAIRAWITAGAPAEAHLPTEQGAGQSISGMSAPSVERRLGRTMHSSRQKRARCPLRSWTGNQRFARGASLRRGCHSKQVQSHRGSRAEAEDSARE